MAVQDAREHDDRDDGAERLRDEIRGDPAPGEVAAEREREAHRGVQVRPRDRPHEQDDRRDHETWRDLLCGGADRVAAEARVHHGATHRDEHEEERSEELREEPAPLVCVLAEQDAVTYEVRREAECPREGGGFAGPSLPFGEVAAGRGVHVLRLS